MSIYRSEALTLRTYPYSESHKIVFFLTRDFGKVRGISYRAESTAARFGSNLEPLTHLVVTFSRKEHQDLAVIKNCETLKAAFAVEEMTLETSLYFSYFAELLNEFSKEEEESDKLFRLSLAVLEVGGKISAELLARYFELWILQLEGILPEFKGRLPDNLAVKSQKMMKLPPAELSRISLSIEEAKKLDSLCGDLIEYHLEKRLKARKLLKQLL